MTMQCFPLADFTEVLDAYDEQPLFIMDTVVKRDKKYLDSQTVITVDIESREWTMYRQVDTETVCVQAAGKNFRFMDMSDTPKKDML